MESFGAFRLFLYLCNFTSKILSLDKAKKLSYYLVLFSLIRIFEALPRRHSRSTNQKNYRFIWFCPRLFVSLQSECINTYLNRSKNNNN